MSKPKYRIAEVEVASFFDNNFIKDMKHHKHEEVIIESGFGVFTKIELKSGECFQSGNRNWFHNMELLNVIEPIPCIQITIDEGLFDI